MKKLFHFIAKPGDIQISKEILFLAYPVIISNLSRVLMNIVDMGMVGHLGANALAAVGMGSMLVWVFISMGISLRTATQTLSSRRLGQRKFSECGTAFRNGFVMAIIFGCSISVLGYIHTERIVSYFMSDPNVIPMCNDYTSIGYLSIFFMVASFVFQGFYTGVERTKVHMVVTITSNIINLYLNAGLIYGSEGLNNFFANSSPLFSWMHVLWGWADFPALGVKGAAIATLIASIWTFIHYCFFLFNKEIRNTFKIFKLKLDYTMMWRQFKLAFPQGLQEMVVTGGFAFFFKILGMIGTIELATTEVVFTVMHASFMPAIGVGQACATLVGKYMGEGKLDIAEIAIWESVRWALIIMGTMGTIFILIPHLILPLFTTDAEIIAYGINGLRIVGLIQYADAVAITLWFALSGAGNTVFPGMVDGILCWFFFLPGSYYFGVIKGFGFWGPWTFFGFYLILFAMIMYWKVKQGTWKTIQV